MGERNDIKGVLLVDVPERGPASVTTWSQNELLKLYATPFYDIKISSSELETLIEQYPNLDCAVVRVQVECQPTDDAITLRRRIAELCPHCLDIAFTGEGEFSNVATGIPATPRDYSTTVTDYLRDLYATDTDLPELEVRASQLLRETMRDETESD